MGKHVVISAFGQREYESRQAYLEERERDRVAAEEGKKRIAEAKRLLRERPPHMGRSEEELRAMYLADTITVEEFEAGLDAIYGTTDIPWRAVAVQ